MEKTIPKGVNIEGLPHGANMALTSLVSEIRKIPESRYSDIVTKLGRTNADEIRNALIMAAAKEPGRLRASREAWNSAASCAEPTIMNHRFLRIPSDMGIIAHFIAVKDIEFPQKSMCRELLTTLANEYGIKDAEKLLGT